MPNHETAPGDNPNTDNPNPDNPWYDFNAPDSIEDYATPEPQSADVSTDALTPAPGSPNQPQQSHEELPGQSQACRRKIHWLWFRASQ